MTKAKARTEGLIVEPSEDGLFVIDERRKSAHYLQRATACVWQHANGERSTEELSEALRAELGPQWAPELVQLSLDVLDRAHLLETGAPSSRLDGISRRNLLAIVGMTSAALITSISLPAQAGFVSGEQ